MVRFKIHADNAVKNFNIKPEYAMQELGRACHFLSDMNEPHHASNRIAGLSWHTQYETFVNENNSKYMHMTM